MEKCLSQSKNRETNLNNKRRENQVDLKPERKWSLISNLKVLPRNKFLLLTPLQGSKIAKEIILLPNHLYMEILKSKATITKK